MLAPIVALAAFVFASGNGAPGASAEEPVKVYFQELDDQVSHEALGVIRNAVATVLKKNGGPIVVEGHTSRFGFEDQNAVLAQIRAMKVRDALIAEGVDPMRITTVSYGESDPAVETPDGAQELRNDRVEIYLGTPH